MKTRNSLAADIFFLVLGLFGIIQSLTFRYWESMALPLGVSGVIFILAAVMVIKDLRRRHSAGAPVTCKTEEENTAKAEFKRFAWVLAWTVAFLLVIFWFGFYIAIPLFALAYVKWTGRSWLSAILFSAGMLALIYGVFQLGLKTELFRGLVFGAR